MKLKLLSVVLFIILLKNNYFIFSVATAATAAFPKKNFVLITINGISMEEVLKFSDNNIKDILNESTIGLLNLRVIGPPTLEKIYLTIGASKRATCVDCNQAYNTQEIVNGIDNAYTIYKNRMGKSPDGSIVQLQIQKILRDNQELIREPTIGLVGTHLKNNQVATFVIGNADAVGEEKINGREVVLAAMDNYGIVKGGNITTELLTSDLTSPYGIKTNYNKLLREYRNALKGDSFIILNIGDFQRLDNYRDYLSDKIIVQEYKKAFNELKKLLEVITSDLRKHNMELMIIFLPPTNREIYTQLGLCAMIKNNIKKGYLTSATTKREGIISVLDIGPTILNFFNIPLPKEMDGKPISYVSDNRAQLASLIKYTSSVAQIDRLWRSIILYLFCFLLIIAYFSLLLKLRYIPLFLIFFCLFLPLSTSFALLSYTYINISISFLYLLSLNFIISLILLLLKTNNYFKLLSICFVTFLIFSSDILLGNHLALDTPFGYSCGIGARFYGIGNFEMASLLGSSFVIIHYVIDKNLKYKYIIGGVLSVFTILLIGLPNLGVNFGGLITATSTFLLYFYFLSKFKINYKNTLFIVMLIVSSLFFISAHSKTHIHTLIEKIISGELTYLIDIITLKLLLLISTFKYIHWNLLFAAFILIPIIVSLLNKEKLIEFIQQTPHIYLSSKALFLGGIVGFAINDSGLAVPCIMWSYLFSIIMLNLSESIKQAQ